MKRSKKAALILMAPMVPFILTGCGEKKTEAVVFSSVEECTSMLTTAAADQCLADFKAAQALHPHVAPKYADKAACEADFGVGQCETAPEQHASGSFFMPLMMGYLAGQMLNRGGATAQPQAQAADVRNGVRSQPLYKSADDRSTFRTASNTPVARSTGMVDVRPSQVQPKASRIAQRGGFGAQAASRQSMGG